MVAAETQIKLKKTENKMWKSYNLLLLYHA
jgi:hypothetical protein